MQILSKPKSHKFISQSQSQSKLPKIILDTNIKKNRSFSRQREKVVSYVRGQDGGVSRALLRKALATYVNFQPNNGVTKFISEAFLSKLKEELKAISYSCSKFSFLLRNVKQIFGEDFQINEKDILAAQGQVTQSSYIFFTTPFYLPYSLCCKSILYLKIRSIDNNSLNRYSDKQINQKVADKIVTEFVCMKCQHVSLVVQGILHEFVKESREKKKQVSQYDIEKYKISMSIMVSSGKFRKMRINQMSHKNIVVPLPEISNPEDIPKRKGHSLILKHLQKREYKNRIKNKE